MSEHHIFKLPQSKTEEHIGRVNSILKLFGILWNRTFVEVLNKLSSTAVDFIRSERELENMHLYGA